MMSLLLVGRNRCCLCGRHNPRVEMPVKPLVVYYALHFTHKNTHAYLKQGQLVHTKQESQLSGAELNVCVGASVAMTSFVLSSSNCVNLKPSRAVCVSRLLKWKPAVAKKHSESLVPYQLLIDLRKKNIIPQISV